MEHFFNGEALADFIGLSSPSTTAAVYQMRRRSRWQINAMMKRSNNVLQDLRKRSKQSVLAWPVQLHRIINTITHRLKVSILCLLEQIPFLRTKTASSFVWARFPHILLDRGLNQCYAWVFDLRWTFGRYRKILVLSRTACWAGIQWTTKSN